MKTKWVATLGAGVLALGLTACSDDKDNNNSENQVPANDTSEQAPNHDENNAASDPNGNENNNVANEETNNQETNENKHDADQPKDDGPETGIDEDDPTITELVNKEYSLGEDDAPDDLVTVDVPTVLDNPEINQLREVAADALKDMFVEAEEAGVYLYARSGYRSYQTQVQLFENYVAEHGEKAANRYSAKPGQSEHQTGLVMDVTSESVNFQLDESFGETEEGEWLQDHAHEFGFIIRYPEGAEDITGYIYEPWHIRYLGVDMATNVYESGLTYEAYIEKEGLIDAVSP